MNLTLPKILASIGLITLVSCVSPSEQFQSSASANAAELRTKNSPFLSAAYGRGVIPYVLEIDGKTTSGTWVGVPQPYRLTPGNHHLLVLASGSGMSQGSVEVVFNFQPSKTYILRGKATGAVFTMELVNTTGGQEVVEKVFKTVGSMSSTMYVPIIISG